MTDIVKNSDEKLSRNEDIESVLSSLWQKANELKGRIYSAVIKHYKEFIHTYTAMNDLNSNVEEIATKLHNIENTMQNHAKPLLVSADNERKEVEESLNRTTVLVNALTQLSQIHQNLSRSSLHLDHKEYHLAANSIVGVQQLLNNVYDNCDTKIFKALKDEARRKRAHLQSLLESEWDKCVTWALPQISLSTPEKLLLGTELKVTANIIRDCDNDNKLQPVLNAMEILGLLQPKLKSFAKKLFRYILNPLITEHSIKPVVEKSNKEIALHFVVSLSLKRKQKDKPINPDVYYNRFTEVFVFLHDKLFGYAEVTLSDQNDDEAQPLIAILGKKIWPALSKAIIEGYLAASMPTTVNELENFAEITKQTALFEYTLKRLGFMDDGICTLSDYTKNVNMSFANKKVQDLLVTARDLLKSDMHNSQEMFISQDRCVFGDGYNEVDDSALKRLYEVDEHSTIEDTTTLEMSLFLFPKCNVSISIIKLMKLAHDTLQEAVKSTPDCAIQLFYATRNMFELFLEVIPTYHKKNLDDIPQLSALHYNNCMYIGHHLLTFGIEFRDHLPPPLSNGAATFVDVIPFLRSSAKQYLSQQLQRQKQLIADCISSTGSWNELAEGNRYMEVKRFLQQGFHQIKHLSKVWFGILPVNLYRQLIGDIANVFVSDVIDNVMKVEDISEEDGQIIHDLLELIKRKMLELHGGRAKDNEDDSTVDSFETAKYVNGWNKLSELTLILELSLKEIGERWNAPQSPLPDTFTATEVHSLIRALFQNTTQRSTTISSIKNL